MVTRPIIIQPSDSSIKLIALTKGQVSLVDTADYEWLMQWLWFAEWSTSTKSFYARRNETLAPGVQRRLSMHRALLGLAYLDHRIGDHREPSQTLNNRRSNLRIANAEESRRNRRMFANNTSGFKGVSFVAHTNKWVALIGVNGKLINLGYFDDKETAYAVYCEAAMKHHGDFARLI